jgi:glutamine amidotransferase
MIAIIDYGLGNPASVRNMLRKAGADAVVTADPDTIRAATRLILPGVGAFDHGMHSLHDRGLVGVLNEAVLQRKIPALGICLGLQLMSKGSEEGQQAGLGWLDADTVKFDGEAFRGLRVPHMGWNLVHPGSVSFLSAPLEEDARFYFVHSYHVRCRRPEDVALTATYGAPIVAGAVRGNIAGTQFHPEKSHRFGLSLLKRFVEWTPRDA